jgi:Tol biopolymer transport system component
MTVVRKVPNSIRIKLPLLSILVLSLAPILSSEIVSAAPAEQLRVLYYGTDFGEPVTEPQHLYSANGESFSSINDIFSEISPIVGISSDASWSPDGSKVVHYTDRKAYLYTSSLLNGVDITGSMINTEDSNQRISPVLWSHDSTKLIFVRTLDDGAFNYTTELVYVNVASNGSITSGSVIDSVVSEGAPKEISPGVLNDDSVIFKKEDGIYRVNISGGTVTQISSGQYDNFTVSYDGSMYSYYASGTELLFVKNTDGSDYSPDYTSGYSLSGSPAANFGMFSRDNKTLIASNYDVFEFELDTQDFRTIADAGPSDAYRAGAFSCSGNELFISGNQNFGSADIFKVDLETLALQNLTNTVSISEGIGQFSVEPFNQDCSAKYVVDQDPNNPYNPNSPNNPQTPKVPRSGNGQFALGLALISTIAFGGLILSKDEHSE